MTVWILTAAEAKDLYSSLCNVWNHAGMQTHKWLSNSVDVLESIPEQDRGTALQIPVGETPLKKVLGVKWDPSDDDFRPYASVKPLQPGHVYTLRQASSCVASQFNPLGMISPVIITGRILM